MTDQKPAPATDEEIADTRARAQRVTGIGSARALKLIARIDAEKEKVAALEALPISRAAKLMNEENAKLHAEITTLRALNAEMLAVLTAMVDAALTDSDACSICLHGCPGHLSGCAKASAEALLAKAKAQR